MLIDTTVGQRPPIITKIALLTRFTDEEFVAVLTAAKTDVEIEAWKTKFDISGNIDLTDPRTIQGLSLFVSKNLITQERMNAILNTPVRDSERP